ncbi:hypothetical protein WR25_06772 isoform A [Diploscapter pachys]|uniref:Mob1/phocein family protein n=1 Tax=Diploscapter pachys TaxID=2018661 RepID=A0A2A2J4E2_9BILA|nr:hypothetical protein WR25_06772 isoform A [Diploscapter pachys]
MNNIPAIANDSTLGGDGRLEDVVRLPDGVDLNEWLSTNLMDSYRQLKMLYGIVCGACTPETCPLMTVGPKHEYSWTDGDQIVPTTATLYIGYVMTWINDMFDDDSTFPTQVGKDFPKNFKKICETISRRMIRVYGHIYLSHFENVREQNAIPHLNTSYKQFYLFTKQFSLITDTDLEPLQEITKKLVPESS